MHSSVRPGKIAGLLVIILLMILIPIWVVGHWISGVYPAAEARTIVEVAEYETASSREFVEPSDIATQSSGDDRPDKYVGTLGLASSQLDSTSGDATDEAIPSAINLKRASDSVDTEQESRLAQLAAMKDELAQVIQQRDQLKTAVTDSQAQYRAASEEARTLKQVSNRLTDQIRHLKETVVAQTEQLSMQKTKLEQQSSQLATRADSPAVDSSEVAQSSRQEPVLTEPNRRRPWTAITGQAVEATFVELDGDMVLFAAQGRIFRVPLSKLMPADQAIVKQLNQ